MAVALRRRSADRRQDVSLDNETYTVVGVMDADFQKPTYAQLWTPLIWEPAEKAVRGEHHFSGVARLKDGVSVAQAQAQLDSIAANLAQQYPADDAGWGALVVPLLEAHVGPVRQSLLVLLGAVRVRAAESRARMSPT
jgi:putative ABC transport system permease protein